MSLNCEHVCNIHDDPVKPAKELSAVTSNPRQPSGETLQVALLILIS